ncbi:MAG: hypothetical protein V4629_12460 [Pseudomonadota bacterium]
MEQRGKNKGVLYYLHTPENNQIKLFLAFTDLPTKIYIKAMLAIYELNNIELLKEIFIWTYERSAQHYQAVHQSLGEPDSFRLKHRESLKQIIQIIIRQQMNKHSVFEFITQKAKELLSVEDQEPFREMIETELLSLHGGNFAKYQITPNEFQQWQEIYP